MKLQRRVNKHTEDFYIPNKANYILYKNHVNLFDALELAKKNLQNIINNPHNEDKCLIHTACYGI